MKRRYLKNYYQIYNSQTKKWNKIRYIDFRIAGIKKKRYKNIRIYTGNQIIRFLKEWKIKSEPIR